MWKGTEFSLTYPGIFHIHTLFLFLPFPLGIGQLLKEIFSIRLVVRFVSGLSLIQIHLVWLKNKISFEVIKIVEFQNATIFSHFESE